MALEIRKLDQSEVAGRIADLAALRIAVFREFPYLYDGDRVYEESYLAPYATTADAVVIGAFDAARLVGAATGMPLTAHAEDFAQGFDGSGIDPASVFYCAESVLLPDWRGQGAGHRFFDLREAAARQQGLSFSAFCSVIRPSDHPARPPGYRSLDVFWSARGYAPLPGVVAEFNWKDLGADQETTKRLQFWGRSL